MDSNQHSSADLMDDIADLRQMASAPSDAYTAGAWCQGMNEALEVIGRLEEQLEAAQAAAKQQRGYAATKRAERAEKQLETTRQLLDDFAGAMITPEGFKRTPSNDEWRKLLHRHLDLQGAGVPIPAMRPE